MNLNALTTTALPKLFEVTYLGLGTSACFIVATLPAILSYFIFGVTGAVAIQALLSLLLYPALAGAFGVFTNYVQNQDCAVVVSFWQHWKRSWRKTTIRGIGYSTICVFLYVDALASLRMADLGLKAAIALLPCIGMIGVLTFRAICISTQLLVERRSPKFRLVAKLLVRRLYLLPVSILAVIVFIQIADTSPILGLGLMTGPILYLLWFEAQQLTRECSTGD